MSIYDFEVTLEDWSKYSLNKYKGRPMLIVNTATKCGFAPQFDGLEALFIRGNMNVGRLINIFACFMH